VSEGKVDEGIFAGRMLRELFCLARSIDSIVPQRFYQILIQDMTVRAPTMPLSFVEGYYSLLRTLN
jgi:hypothetical protein